MRRSLSKKEMSRRSFLGYATGTIAAGITLLLGLPGIRYFLSPALTRKEASSPTNLGPVSQFQVNKPKAVAYEILVKDGWYVQSERKAVWVVKYEDGSLVVFDPRCTHLACAYSWKEEGPHQGHFFCPCHDGVYDIKGNVLSGPPPRPLDRIEYKVENGELVLLSTVVRGDNLGQYRTTRV